MGRRLLTNMQSQKEKRAKTTPEMNYRAIPWARAELLSASAVFLIALVLYGLTLAPTVTLVDSGELILAAQGLGVAPRGLPFSERPLEPDAHRSGRREHLVATCPR